MIFQGYIHIYFPSTVNVPGKKASGLSYSLLYPQDMALGVAHDRHLWNQSGMKWKNRYLNVGLFKRMQKAERESCKKTLGGKRIAS